MEVLISLVLIHVVLLLAATLVIVSSNGSTQKQKMLQFLLISGLPLLGSVIVIWVLLSDRFKSKTPSDRYIGQSIDEHASKWYGIFPNN